MLERIPHLSQFMRLYWGQMGPECYGEIGTAFRQFLSDASRLPDGGASIRRGLVGELMLICDNPKYAEWVQLGLYDGEIGRAVGGRFIGPEEGKPLLQILDEGATFDS